MAILWHEDLAENPSLPEEVVYGNPSRRNIVTDVLLSLSRVPSGIA